MGVQEDPVYLLTAVYVPSSFAAQSDLIVPMTLEIQVPLFALFPSQHALLPTRKPFLYPPLGGGAGPSLPGAWDSPRFHEPLKKYLTNGDGTTELPFS